MKQLIEMLDLEISNREIELDNLRRARLTLNGFPSEPRTIDSKLPEVKKNFGAFTFRLPEAKKIMKSFGKTGFSADEIFEKINEQWPGQNREKIKMSLHNLAYNKKIKKIRSVGGKNFYAAK